MLELLAKSALVRSARHRLRGLFRQPGPEVLGDDREPDPASAEAAEAALEVAYNCCGGDSERLVYVLAETVRRLGSICSQRDQFDELLSDSKSQGPQRKASIWILTCLTSSRELRTLHITKEDAARRFQDAAVSQGIPSDQAATVVDRFYRQGRHGVIHVTTDDLVLKVESVEPEFDIGKIPVPKVWLVTDSDTRGRVASVHSDRTEAIEEFKSRCEAGGIPDYEMAKSLLRLAAGRDSTHVTVRSGVVFFEAIEVDGASRHRFSPYREP